MFEVGDKVKSDFWKGEEHIVRTVLRVDHNVHSQTGIAVEADGGEPCPRCGLKGKPIKSNITDQGVDAAWFTHV